MSKNEKNLLKNIGVEKVKNVKDISKLSLRERLALRVASGNIDTFLNNLDNNSNKENNINNNISNKILEDDPDIKEVEEILDKNDEFLKKKKNPSTKKSNSVKKIGKSSTKKKKIIDSDDDDKDEDFNL